MQCVLNWSTGKRTAMGKNYQQPISQGQFYTFPHAKSSEKVLLLNFEPKDIQLNESALKEMVRMRNESLFSWQHPLIELNGISMCLFIRRSWNCHLEHFLKRQNILNLFQPILFHRNQYNIVLQNILMTAWMIGETSIRIHNMAWFFVATSVKWTSLK